MTISTFFKRSLFFILFVCLLFEFCKLYLHSVFDLRKMLLEGFNDSNIKFRHEPLLVLAMGSPIRSARPGSARNFKAWAYVFRPARGSGPAF